MTTPLAYHNTPALKTETLEQLAEHRRLDQIAKFPELYGIPVELAYLVDVLHERLPKAEALEWPTRVMGAIPVGADLSMVWSRWALWMLRGLPVQSRAVLAVATLYERRLAGDEPTGNEWATADEAAEVARAAAWPGTAAWAAAAAAGRAALAPAAAAAAWPGTAATAAAARAEWVQAACDELVRLLSDAPAADDLTDQLASALERSLNNLRRLAGRTPVRDLAETEAEAEAALAAHRAAKGGDLR